MEDKALLSTEEASGAEKAELLIVIPAYNEAENIERVVNHLTANFPQYDYCLLYTSPSPRDGLLSRMPSSA